MGEVFKAYDTHRDRYVALKLLPEAFSGDQEYLKRFRRESNVAARLRDPHVVPIHDFGEIDGRLYIDMRLVDGADIAALLDQQGPMAPQRAVYLISQAAQALDAAHADQLVHRDIKPSNILVTPNDFVYVVDFGIARATGGPQTSLTITGATIGTLHYMAPERFAGHAVDGRADVYSLACVLHECLTGTAPFKANELPALIYAQLYSDPPAASSLVEGIPPALDAVIARGMAKDPEHRFATAGALAEAARDALMAGTQGAPTMVRKVSTWTEVPAPVWEAAPATTSWAGAPEAPAAPAPERQPAFEPAAPEPRPAFEPVAPVPAAAVPSPPTQTMLAAAVTDHHGTQPSEAMPSGHGLSGPGPSGPGPAGPGAGLLAPAGPGQPPYGAPDWPPREPAPRPSRGRNWRLLAALAAVAVVALVLPFVLIHRSSGQPNANNATPAANSSSGTGTASATALAMPTVAGKIQVGQTPNYVQVAPGGKTAYVTNPGSKTVTVIDTASNLVAKVIKIPQGPPQSLAFSPDGKTAYVSVYGKGIALVAFVDTASGTVTASVPVNNFTPGPSATSPDGRYLYVPNHNEAMTAGQNVIDVIDTVTRKVVHGIAVPNNPHWIVFGNDGVFYSSDHMSTTVTALNSHTNKIITEIQVGETPHGEAISPDHRRLAVTSYNGNQVFIIDTATNKQIATIPTGRLPLDTAYSPDGRYLFTTNNQDNTVTVISAADNKVLGTVATGKEPTTISVLPNGRQAYVTDEGDSSVEVLNIAK